TGIYALGETLDEITLDSIMTRLIFEQGQAPIGIIIPDPHQDRLWYFTENGIKYIDRSSLSGSLNVTNIPIPSSLVGNLGVSGFENISRIADNQYLIGSSNGYLALDLEKVAPATDRIAINSIRYGDYGKVTDRAPNLLHGEFEFAQNNLIFQYAVPEYDKYTEVRFQHRLEGLYNEWSPWT